MSNGMSIAALFEAFKSLKVGVIGDVMLDSYMWGHVERISPEAPVPIVALDRKELRIGGAGNVALNLCSLGAKASVLTVTGNDEDGKLLEDLFEQHGISTEYMVKSDARITTNKTRIISRNQQMMRLDAEMTADIGAAEEEALLNALQKFINEQKPAVVVLEDYNKGVLTDRLIRKIIGVCREYGVVTAADPKRVNFFSYQGVDIFKPNLKEVKDALNLLNTDVSEAGLAAIHQQLHEQLQHRISFITLSEKGVYYNDGADQQRIIPSHLRNIADVSGAGDTVIAVASLVYAITRNPGFMAAVANIAGGLVCEVVGTAAIDRDRLRQECELLM